MVFVWLFATMIRVVVWMATRVIDWQERRKRGVPSGPLVSLHELGQRWLVDVERARDRRRTMREGAIYRWGRDRRTASKDAGAAPS